MLHERGAADLAHAGGIIQDAFADFLGAQVGVVGVRKRRMIAEIRRNKVASVNVPFFKASAFGASDGNLSRQFIDFFALTPARAGESRGLVKKAKEGRL